MQETGFCWNCGKVIKNGEFCSIKCSQQYQRKQDRQIRKGKRAGYGLAGSTH